MSGDFARYHCQMALPGFGRAGQQQLRSARVLIVGAGGLGCPAGQYLAAAGIGTLGIADDDMVSETNLHRQILFTPQDIGASKACLAARRLRQQNPSIQVVDHPIRVDRENVMKLIAGYDLVVDGTDNFDTRYLLNDACVLSNKPLIYGSIYQHEGQMAVLNVLLPDGTYSPNYRDIFARPATAVIPDCAQGGVMPALAGMVGCLQAGEVIKYFVKRADLLTGKLCILNLQSGQIYQIGLRKDPAVTITELPAGVRFIEAEALDRRVVDLIDVRSKAEHEAFNIGGKQIALEQLAGQLPFLATDRPIVCYCASGKRSMVAARVIQQYFPAATVYALKNGVGQLKSPAH